MNILLTPFRLLKISSLPRTRDLPRVDSNGPNVPESKLPTFGNYCIKAYSSLQQNDKTFHFEGYYPDLTISDIVEAKCRMHEKDGHKCTPTQMLFLGPIRDCNKIVMSDDDGKRVKEWYLL